MALMYGSGSGPPAQAMLAYNGVQITPNALGDGSIPCSRSASFPDHAAREGTGVAVQAMLSFERDSLRAVPDLGMFVCLFG